ncbi:4489_t:CDS:2, partial [Entrophospora sp. SA101]
SQRDFDRMDYYKWDELDSNVMLNGGKNSKDVEEALYKIINIALKQGKLKDRKASQIYSRYLNKLQSMSNTEFRVKLLAKKIIPDDEAYASKSNAIYRWHPYEMATEIDKLFILLKDISKEAIKGSTNQIYQHAKWKQREKALRAKHVNYETECAKYARLKKKDKNLRANHAKLKQRFRLLEQQVNQPLANMATLEHVMLALAPLVAQIPLYTGQEPPDAYIDKMEQLFTYGTALNVAGFNAAVKTDILKSKMSGKYAPVPAQHNGNNIDTLARFRGWLRHKYQTKTVGSQLASIQRLTQEKFLNSDTPETYEYRIRPLLLGVANDDANLMTFIMNHLPDELFT